MNFWVFEFVFSVPCFIRVFYAGGMGFCLARRASLPGAFIFGLTQKRNKKVKAEEKIAKNEFRSLKSFKLLPIASGLKQKRFFNVLFIHFFNAFFLRPVLNMI